MNLNSNSSACLYCVEFGKSTRSSKQVITACMQSKQIYWSPQHKFVLVLFLSDSFLYAALLHRVLGFPHLSNHIPHKDMSL